MKTANIVYRKLKVDAVPSQNLESSIQLPHVSQLSAAMMSWVGCLLTDSSATRYMKVRRMGITEILRRIGLFSANKIKISESVSKQPTQLIVELNSSLRHIIVTF